jgi:hypothetical protein
MEIDLIMVKGKKQPEAVFTVLGRSEVEADPRCQELRPTNTQMLGALPQAAMGRRHRLDRALPQIRQWLRSFRPL